MTNPIIFYGFFIGCDKRTTRSKKYLPAKKPDKKNMNQQFLSTLFAILSIMVMAFSATLIVLRIFSLATKKTFPMFDTLYAIAPGLLTAVAGTAMLGSLYYSEIVGYTPCVLCWYQRIAIYSIAIISTVALFKKHTREFRAYVLVFAILGIPISIYHAWLQAYPRATSFCTLEAPCAERHVWEFGFVSIPFMALSVLLFTITLILTTTKLSHEEEYEIESAERLGL